MPVAEATGELTQKLAIWSHLEQQQMKKGKEEKQSLVFDGQFRQEMPTLKDPQVDVGIFSIQDKSRITCLHIEHKI